MKQAKRFQRKSRKYAKRIRSLVNLLKVIPTCFNNKRRLRKNIGMQVSVG
jgi:hypothetical protein